MRVASFGFAVHGLVSLLGRTARTLLQDNDCMKAQG